MTSHRVHLRAPDYRQLNRPLRTRFSLLCNSVDNPVLRLLHPYYLPALTPEVIVLHPACSSGVPPPTVKLITLQFLTVAQLPRKLTTHGSPIPIDTAFQTRSVVILPLSTRVIGSRAGTYKRSHSTCVQLDTPTQARVQPNDC